MQVQDRDSGQYLQDDGTAFTTFGGTANTLNATLSGHRDDPDLVDPGHRSTTNRNLLVSAQAFTAATGGTGDSTRATKKFESFSTEDQTPTTSINGPSGTSWLDTTFTDDRHRQRRQGRQLAVVLVPRRAAALPAGRRHGRAPSSTPSAGSPT